MIKKGVDKVEFRKQFSEKSVEKSVKPTLTRLIVLFLKRNLYLGVGGGSLIGGGAWPSFFKG